jgi:hypothetical protein
LAGDATPTVLLQQQLLATLDEAVVRANLLLEPFGTDFVRREDLLKEM